MPPFAGSPFSVRAGSAKATWVGSFVGGLAGAAASAVLFRVPELGPILGSLGVCGSAYLALRSPPEMANAQKLVSQLSTSWRNVETQWNQAKEPRQFTDQRHEADEIIRAFKNLGAEEARELANLQAKARDRQLRTFLQRFYIDHANIKGLGNTRKVVLRSYGIETAADVDARRIEAIKGFGPSLAGNIVAWRKSLEHRFVFNPNQPINPADVLAVKTAIANKRIDLEKKLRTALSELEKRSNGILSLRNSLKSSAEQVWKAKRQAELDHANLASSYYSTPVRFATLAGAVVVSVVVQNAVLSNISPSMPDVPRSSRASLPANSSPTFEASNRQEAQTPQPQPPARDKIPATSETAQARSPGGGPPLTPSQKSLAMLDKVLQARTASGGGTVNAYTTAAPSTTATESKSQSFAQPPIASAHQTETAPQSAQSKGPTEAPPLPPPQIVPGTPGSMPTTGTGSEKALVPTESPTPLNREVVSGIQSRLRELGFLDRYAPGVWDADSRKALREFKLTNHLIDSDVWDVAAERALRALSPI